MLRVIITAYQNYTGFYEDEYKNSKGGDCHESFMELVGENVTINAIIRVANNRIHLICNSISYV